MKERILKNIQSIRTDGKSTVELYNEISEAVMRELTFTPPAPDKKSAYYLSIEFLIGRMFYNNLMELGVLEDVRGISIVRFTTEDVVRHPLVGAIVRAYEKAEKEAEAAARERREAARQAKEERYGKEESNA